MLLWMRHGSTTTYKRQKNNETMETHQRSSTKEGKVSCISWQGYDVCLLGDSKAITMLDYLPKGQNYNRTVQTITGQYKL